MAGSTGVIERVADSSVAPGGVAAHLRPGMAPGGVAAHLRPGMAPGGAAAHLRPGMAPGGAAAHLRPGVVAGEMVRQGYKFPTGIARGVERFFCFPE